MAATRQDIEQWLDEGKSKGATHIIVVCDTFDYEDYPVYVMPGTNGNAILKHYQCAEMQRVMEVYDLNMDIEAQLAEHRAWHPPKEEE